MDKSGRGRRVKNGGNVADEPNEFEIGMNSDSVFVIKVPDSRSLRVLSRSLFLAAVLLALPTIGAIIRAASYAPPLLEAEADSDWLKNLPLLLHDLMEEGLITQRHKGFVLASAELDFDAGVDLAAGADLPAHQVFDYIYAASFSGIELVGAAVRDGGLAIAPLGGDLSAELSLLRNFKVVYLRKLDGKTVVAMRKSAAANSAVRQEVLCGIAPEEKESALRGLEEVYLEPPRLSKTKKSSFKFLPDLMKDPLDEYERRIFIADDAKALDWLYKNYPMRGQEFQVYKMEVERELKLQEMGVRVEDYVVMKAEARVVEEMMREKSLCMVDELFLECRGDEDEEEREGGGARRGRRRAYWECVALYGKIRDEGIAVHQWWF